ncbi:MAG: hypothetical protein L6V93_22020 [Clostridiales bacterium]|nr:MAG: hypothetical protein L6V93_22020 [Clostridiales bacterium]
MKNKFLVLIAMLVNLFRFAHLQKRREYKKIESLFFYDEFGNVCLNAGENEKEPYAVRCDFKKTREI